MALPETISRRSCKKNSNHFSIALQDSKRHKKESVVIFSEGNSAVKKTHTPLYHFASSFFLYSRTAKGQCALINLERPLGGVLLLSLRHHVTQRSSSHQTTTTDCLPKVALTSDKIRHLLTSVVAKFIIRSKKEPFAYAQSVTNHTPLFPGRKGSCVPPSVPSLPFPNN